MRHFAGPNSNILLALAIAFAVQPSLFEPARAEKRADYMTVGGSLRDARTAAVLDAQGVSAVQAISNTPVCAAIYDQFSPVVLADGNGGAVAVWADYRAGELDIYAQKLNESGSPQWPVDGVPVCKGPGNQSNPSVVSDGAGGIIVAWQDGRHGGADIYAQRIASSGAALWSASGVAVSGAANLQREPVVCGDGAGGAIVAWVDERGADADVYVQRVNAAGAVQWTADGVVLCTATGAQDGLAIAADDQGGAFVFWLDLRGAEADVYARRVDAVGSAQWAADGVAVCAAGGAQQTVRAIADGSGGAIAVWADGRGADLDVFAQRLNASGTLQWAADGVALCTAGGDQRLPRLCSDGANGALVAWEDRRGAEADVYARRVSDAGVSQWAANGVAVCSAAGHQLAPAIAVDPTGAAVVAWTDERTLANGQDVYVQRVGLDGGMQWAPNGSVVCDAGGNQDAPGVAVNALGGAITAWRDFRPGVNSDLYSQRVDAGGVVPNQCASTIPLQASSVATASSPIQFYTFDQQEFYWAGVGVRPAAGADWDLEVYEPNTFGMSAYPVCFENPYAGSFLASGVDFVVLNCNPGRTPLGDYGTRVSRYSGASSGQVEWDDALDTMSKDCTGGNCGARSGNNWSGVLDVYDLFLFGGQTYTFELTKTGTADIKFLLYSAAGSGNQILPRGAAALETSDRWAVYEAPVTGFYGVVLVNDNGQTGTYVLKATTGIPLGVGDPVAGATAIRGVAPNPSRGEARIQFALERPSEVSFQVVDMQGRAVGSVPARRWESGSWSVSWAGQGRDGRALPPGVYFVQMKVDGRTVGTSRLALIR